MAIDIYKEAELAYESMLREFGSGMTPWLDLTPEAKMRYAWMAAHVAKAALSKAAIAISEVPLSLKAPLLTKHMRNKAQNAVEKLNEEIRL
jgi:hypothetical protein